MATLWNKTQGKVLTPKLRVADGFFSRAIGLMAQKPLSLEQGLWITPCNSIHTYFMKFPLDCVFVDKSCRVVDVRTNLQPWRIVLPIKGAYSVFEFSAGWLAQNPVSKGDQLHVRS